MREVRVAIISKRQELVRFFELEALNFGFSVSLFERMPAETLSFDVLVVDSSLIKQPPSAFGGNGKILLVTELDDAPTDVGEGVERIAYPTAIRVLRSAYESALYRGAESERTTVRDGARDAEKIHFYRELKNTVCYRGRNISLSDYEMRLLLRLCQSGGEAVGREELNLLLGAERGNIADVYICRLRKKLEEADGKRVIFTERSKGYRILAEMEWE